MTDQRSVARVYPSAITGTWSDLERHARHVYETYDHDSNDYELAEAVLVLLSQTNELAEEIQRRAAENARLYDGVAATITAIWSLYEQTQSVARKPSPNV